MTRSVLIIDGDATFCQLTTQLLEPLQIKVSPSHLGRPGFNLAEKEKPDLVILSAELEDMNGYMVCKKLRDHPATSSAKVIITSTVAKEDDFNKHKKLRGRADQYLKKPISDRDMLFHISEQLGLNLRPTVFDGKDDDQKPDTKPTAPASDVMDKAEVHDASLDFLNAIDAVGQTLQEKNAASGNQASKPVLTLETQRQRIDYLEKEIEAFKGANQEIQAIRKTNVANEKLIEELKTELAALEKSGGAERSAETADLHSEAERLQNQLDAGEIREKDLKEELAKTLEQHKAETLELTRAKEQAEMSLAKSGDLEQKLERAQSRYDDLKKEADQLSTLLKEAEAGHKSSQNEAEHRSKECSRLQDENDQFREELGQLKQQSKKEQTNAGEIRKEHLQLQDEYASLKTEMATLNKQKTESDRACKSAQDKLNNVQEQLAVAEKSTREAMNRVENQAESIAELEAEKNGLINGRETLEGKMNAARKESDHLQENYHRELETLKAGHKRELAEKTKELSTKNEDLNLELKRLRNANDERIMDLNKEQAQLQETFNAKKQELLDQLAEAQRESHQEQEESFRLKKRLKAQEETHFQELERLRAANDTEKSRLQLESEEELNRFKADFGKQLEDLNKKIEALSTANNSYATQMTQLEQRTQDIETERQGERDSARQQIDDLEGKLAGMAAELKKAQEAEESLQAKVHDLERENNQATANHEEALRDVEKDLNDQLVKESQKHNLLVVECQQLKAEMLQLDKLKQENKTMAADLGKLKLGHETLKGRLEGARHALEAGLKEITGASMNLEFEED